MLQDGELGIHPPGALGVAFFAHARAECIIGRSGDGITDVLKKAGSMRLDDSGTLRIQPLRNRIFSNLLEADALNRTPELLFVCCNPNQLGLFTGELTAFLENLAGRGRLTSIDDVRRRAPILLILPNGVLAEQTVQTYEDQLRESVLMRRLPGVTPDMVNALLDRLVRGISLQAGGRRGSGAETTYVLERKGTLIFAGGGEFEQERVGAILTAHNYPFKHARGVSGTRVEFDKAMISIVLNVGGLIHMVKDDGDLVDLRMGDLCEDPSKQEFIHSVTRAVFGVGRAIGAYPPDADFDAIWTPHRATIMAHAGHVTSSVKTFRDALAGGLAGVKLFSNEEWILSPLGRYAAKAGMSAEEGLLRSLKNQVQDAMARAIRFSEQDAGGGNSRTKTMKMIAQRNFTVEMHDAGADNMVLIGSMLDDEHLIKLEVNVHLPDEQITRSRLEMIRVPFPVCREVEAAAESLVGLRIERGVMNEIARRTGGRAGCSHIKELAANIVYFAASHIVRRRSGADPMTADYALKPPEERFVLTKGLLRDSCLAYCQTTPRGLDEQIGIRRVGEEHTHPLPLGTYEPSLGILLKDRTSRWGDKTILRYRVNDHIRDLSWNETAALTWQIARHLIDQGIRAGDRICMLSENRHEMYVFELAVMSIGAVAVPIFAGYPAGTVAYVLEHARPRFVVVSGKHQLDKIDRNKHPWIEQYYCMDFDADSAQRGALNFAALTAKGGATPDELTGRVESVEPDDPCVVMYTSGTTGPPKGVQLSHRNLISQQKAISLIWDVDEHDAALSYLPWHHSFGGLFERCLALYHGCELCIDDSRGRDMDRLIENWRAFNPTLFFSVPRVHDLLVARCREQSEIADAVLGARLRFVFTAGASLPAHVEIAYRERNIPVLEGWGLTETSPCATLTTLDGHWQSGYVGLPIPGVSIRIDSDQEILVRGPNVMAGYLDDEDATARVFDPDGWFRTGDLGEFTPNGLRLFGRRDGAFKLTTGEKVHPQRIESVLVNESSYISAAVAVGSGKDCVGVLIYPDLGNLHAWGAKQDLGTEDMISTPAVRELFAAELARINPLIEVSYQRVRRAVILDHVPSSERGELTPTGKLVRKAVISIHRHALDGMFAPDAPVDVVIVPQPESKRTYAHAR